MMPVDFFQECDEILEKRAALSRSEVDRGVWCQELGKMIDGMEFPVGHFRVMDEIPNMDLAESGEIFGIRGSGINPMTQGSVGLLPLIGVWRDVREHHLIGID